MTGFYGGFAAAWILHGGAVPVLLAIGGVGGLLICLRLRLESPKPGVLVFQEDGRWWGQGYYPIRGRRRPFATRRAAWKDARRKEP